MTTLTYTIQLARRSNPAPLRAVVLLEYKDPANNTYRQATLVLDADVPQRNWQVEVATAGTGQAFHSSLLDYETGEQVAGSSVAFVGTEATIDGAPDPDIAVVVPDAFDWTSVSSIQVTLGGASHTFSKERPYAWCFTLPASSVTEWTANYTMTDRSTRTNTGVAASGMVVVPVPPSEVRFSADPADFTAFAVAAVEIRAISPDGVVRVGRLTKPSPNVTLSLPVSGLKPAWFVYEWTVSYNDGTPDWTAPTRTSDGQQSIVLGDFGRILLTSDAIDFSVVQKVTLSWRKGGEPRTTELSAVQRSVLLVPGTDYDREQPLVVGLTYMLAAGSADLSGEAVPRGRFDVPNPVGERLIRIYAPGMLGDSPAYREINLSSVRTLEQGKDWSLQKSLGTIQLTPTAPAWQAHVAAVDPERVMLSFSGTATPSDGGARKPIGSTKSPFALTPIGPEIHLATVQISAQAVFWDRYARVEASLWTGDVGDKGNLQTFSFDRNSADAWWAYLQPTDASGPSFEWSAKYYPIDGGAAQDKSPSSSRTTRLVLDPFLS